MFALSYVKFFVIINLCNLKNNTMKANIILLSTFLLALSCTPQNASSPEDEQLKIKNAALLERINQKTAPGYKLYKTNNMWTFIELETFTGRMWQVQYSVESKEARGKVELSPINLAGGELYEYAGRFELYPTQNIYNFILLDTETGKTWQAQWSFEPENRGIIEIE